MDLELPMVFKYHVFACFTKRPAGHPRGSCMEKNAQPLWDRLQQKLEAKQLPDVNMSASGCLSFCRAGPLIVVYPGAFGTGRGPVRTSMRLSNRISSRASRLSG